MALNYMVYQYDGSRNVAVMTGMDGRELVIDCDRAEEQVVFDEPEDAGIFYLVWLYHREKNCRNYSDGMQKRRRKKGSFE